MTPPRAPCLVIGWGNRARGDDALGPLCLDALAAALPAAASHPNRHAQTPQPERPAQPAWPGWPELLELHQLQPEQVLDIDGRECVLFIDTHATLATPWAVQPLQPASDASAFSHALSPAALLHIHARVLGRQPPPATLLALRGRRFGLGEPPSADALAALDEAVGWVLAWLGLGARPVACGSGSGPGPGH